MCARGLFVKPRRYSLVTGRRCPRRCSLVTDRRCLVAEASSQVVVVLVAVVIIVGW